MAHDDRPCSVDGCSDTKIKAKGLCPKHYTRLWLYGTTDATTIKAMHAEKRAAKRPDGKLWCSRCQQFLDEGEFRPRKGKRPDSQCWCKKCHAAYDREYRMAKAYSLTLEQVDEVFARQGGRCRICTKELVLGGREPNSAKVDHDHKTGAVRGLLCDHCNRGLGFFLDSDVALETAARYVRGEI